MLTTTSFIIALLGCSHDMETCSAQAAMPVTYASREQCVADLDRALEEAAVDGPMIVAECQALDRTNAHLVMPKAQKHAALTR